MSLTTLIGRWRFRAAREARQSIADAYLECAAELEALIEAQQGALREFREGDQLSNIKTPSSTNTPPPPPPPPRPQKKKASNY